VEIKDQRKVPVLKFWVRRSLVRLPLWAKATLTGLAQALCGRGGRSRGKRGERWECERSQGRRGGGKGVGTNPECAPEPTDNILTTPTRIRIGTTLTSVWLRVLDTWPHLVPACAIHGAFGLARPSTKSSNGERPLRDRATADRFLGVPSALRPRALPEVAIVFTYNVRQGLSASGAFGCAIVLGLSIRPEWSLWTRLARSREKQSFGF
jgi:hypothetical protein